ncbi:MAG: hypothetical protein ACNA7W_11235 [Pseudomonadales bacterium]
MNRLRLNLHRLLARVLYGSEYKTAELQLRTADIEPEFWAVWEQVSAFTMTPAVRAYAMYQACSTSTAMACPGRWWNAASGAAAAR